MNVHFIYCKECSDNCSKNESYQKWCFTLSKSYTRNWLSKITRMWEYKILVHKQHVLKNISTLFSKNKTYKNIEAENGKILRICQEYSPG